MIFGVVCRIQRNELPYINFFLEWYLKLLEFDKILLLIHDKTPPKHLEKIDIKDYINKDFYDKIELINCEYVNHPNYCMHRERKQIKLDLDICLNIDLDEFLLLPNKQNIKEFIKSNNIINENTALQFKWIMISCNSLQENNYLEYFKSDKTNIFKANRGKRLFFTKNINEIQCHKVKINNNFDSFIDIEPKINNPILIHFCSRGIKDLVIKNKYQNTGKNQAYLSKEKLNNFLNNKINNLTSMPNRILYLGLEKFITQIDSNLKEYILNKFEENYNKMQFKNFDYITVEKFVNENKLETFYNNWINKNKNKLIYYSKKLEVDYEGYDLHQKIVQNKD